MFGMTFEDEQSVHEKIAFAILVQSLPIFLLLYFVIPGMCFARRVCGKKTSPVRVRCGPCLAHSEFGDKPTMCFLAQFLFYPLLIRFFPLRSTLG